MLEASSSIFFIQQRCCDIKWVFYGAILCLRFLRCALCIFLFRGWIFFEFEVFTLRNLREYKFRIFLIIKIYNQTSDAMMTKGNKNANKIEGSWHMNFFIRLYILKKFTQLNDHKKYIFFLFHSHPSIPQPFFTRSISQIVVYQDQGLQFS